MLANNRLPIGIIGTGHALPDEVITNACLQECAGLSDEWILARTGIRERRRAGEDETASTLGARAALNALEMANLAAADVDLIVCTTISPDVPMPATACLIQALIGAKKAVCFDLSAACSGFLYGLEVAEKLVRSGAYKNALLISVDLMTRWIDYTDAQTCALFGDGAGAVVLGGTEVGRGILGTKLYSDGNLADLAIIPAGGSKLPTSRETLEGNLHKLKMNGKRTFKYAVQSMTAACENILESLDLCACQIDLVVPHQANQRIIDAVTIALEIDSEKVFSNIAEVGNTASASIPIALDNCLREGIIKPESLVLLTAFGGGAAWGASAIRF
jgi:3-oxoacyl-[acyl-carrier-protein] synthase-3